MAVGKRDRRRARLKVGTDTSGGYSFQMRSDGGLYQERSQGGGEECWEVALSSCIEQPYSTDDATSQSLGTGETYCRRGRAPILSSLFMVGVLFLFLTVNGLPKFLRQGGWGQAGQALRVHFFFLPQLSQVSCSATPAPPPLSGAACHLAPFGDAPNWWLQGGLGLWRLEGGCKGPSSSHKPASQPDGAQNTLPWRQPDPVSGPVSGIWGLLPGCGFLKPQ